MPQGAFRGQGKLTRWKSKPPRSAVLPTNTTPRRNGVRSFHQKGGRQAFSTGMFAKATAADVGLSGKEIHRARQIRDAENRDPGIVRRTQNFCGDDMHVKPSIG